MVKLIIEDDEGKTTVVPLIRDEISIGRKEGNTIRLTERNVSRRHARLVKNNGAVFIEDLSSYNGIKVNGNKIAGRVAVTEGDRIQIGDYVLGLKLEGSAQLAPRPTTPEEAKTTEMRRQDAATPDAKAADAETAHIKIDDVPDAQPAEPTSTDPTKAAKLVCVSLNFARSVFPLTKSAMVLGRTDDNDVVINHRSISRHHCRVVEEVGRYTIIDLQSANGVRVNGEEYGKVELRKGDQIDLGHVRLRFVAPGEIFDVDGAEIVDTTKAGGGGKGIWVGVGLVLLLGLGFLVWRYMGSSDPRPKDPGNGSATTKTPGKLPSGNNVDQDRLLGKITTAISDEAWDSAVDHCAKLDEASKAKAKANCDKAQNEKLWKKAFDDAEAKATQLKYVEALQDYNRIPTTSVYAKKRDESATYMESKAKHIAQQLKLIEDHVTKGECELAKVKVLNLKKLVPDETQGDVKAKACKPATVADANPPPTKTKRPRIRRPRTKTKRPPPKVAVAADPAKVKALLAAAQKAYMAGHYGKAIGLGKKVVALDGVNVGAWQVIGVAACYRKQITLVKSAYRKLGVRRRNLLKTVCMRNGITL